MRAAYAAGDTYRAQYGPVAVPPDGTLTGLFNPNVYQGGALVLYALRQEIGTDAFDALERAWVTTVRERRGEHGRLHRPGVEGRRAATSARSCTRGSTTTTTPPMPGHPDWTVDPVTAPEPVPAA